MSNTRRAEAGSPLHQERWRSSEEYERGLQACHVAPRCQKIERAEERDLIYFLQYRSSREGGFGKTVEDLLALFPDRFRTLQMRKHGTKPGQIYSTPQVIEIRSRMHLGGENGEESFLLKGELRCSNSLEQYQELRKDRRDEDAQWFIDADRQPADYPASDFLERCVRYARTNLPSILDELCLNPAIKMEQLRPWFCDSLPECLFELQSMWAKQHAGGVITGVGRLVNDALDYALESKCLVLVEGKERIGKSHSAKAWCEQRPGRVRYVQIPSQGSDVEFYRAIAKGLGMSCGRSWKSVQLRLRIEDTLQTGDLMLVMDEAHYLWPVSDCKNSLPGRVNWVMTALVNHGVPVALVTTPQFIRTQKAVEKRTHWTSGQFIGRIGHYQPLPDSLDESDLAKVAKVFLPEGDPKSISGLVHYAQGSAKYLAGIETVARRARYLAKKDGREKVERADIKRAINEAAIPSDTALAKALAETKRHGMKLPAESMVQPPFNDVARDNFTDSVNRSSRILVNS